MGIGERIRQRRAELGMSQCDLADRMGYNNHSTVAKIENGAVDIPHSRIVQFAEVLSVSVEYLMGLDSTPQAALPNKLGQRIRAARLAKGMTQEELGQLLGVEKSAVAKYENGRIVNLKQTTLKKISEILEIPASEMIVGDEAQQGQGVKNAVSDSHGIFAENLRYYISKSGRTQSEIADTLGIPLMTFNDWVRGKTYPRIDKLEMLSQYFGVSKSELIEKKQVSEVEKQRADSRIVFSTNLRLFMAKAGKSRREVSEAIGVSYFTFSDWCNGKKYPRIEKLEALAEYFGVSVPDLIDSRETDGVHVPEITEFQEPARTELERVGTFASRLQLAMDRTGIKRVELVKATGIDQGAMTNYLKGRYEPKQDTVAKLAKVLNVSERWLWGYGSEAEMLSDNHIPAANQEQKAKEDVLDVILRLRADTEFLEIVEKLVNSTVKN